LFRNENLLITRGQVKVQFEGRGNCFPLALALEPFEFGQGPIELAAEVGFVSCYFFQDFGRRQGQAGGQGVQGQAFLLLVKLLDRLKLGDFPVDALRRKARSNETSFQG
jgi:hypothetical protein